LFQVELEQLIDLHHPLVQLGMRIDWESFEQALGATYHPTQGAPGIQTRLMVALHYLKYQHDLSDEIGSRVSEAYVDMGYRGHNYEGEVTVRVDKRQRGRTPRPLWRWMKRRAAVEPSIGHLKSEHRLERNRLKGVAGDAFNAIAERCGNELPKAPGGFLAHFLRRLLRGWGWIPLLQVQRLFQSQSANA
jgi:hypothetical protein